jgi:hypothetical protein
MTIADLSTAPFPPNCFGKEIHHATVSTPRLGNSVVTGFHDLRPNGSDFPAAVIAPGILARDESWNYAWYESRDDSRY